MSRSRLASRRRPVPLRLGAAQRGRSEALQTSLALAAKPARRFPRSPGRGPRLSATGLTGGEGSASPSARRPMLNRWNGVDQIAFFRDKRDSSPPRTGRPAMSKSLAFWPLVVSPGLQLATPAAQVPVVTRHRRSRSTPRRSSRTTCDRRRDRALSDVTPNGFGRRRRGRPCSGEGPAQPSGDHERL